MGKVVRRPPSSARTACLSKLLLDAMQLRNLLPYAKLDLEGYETRLCFAGNKALG